MAVYEILDYRAGDMPTIIAVVFGKKRDAQSILPDLARAMYPDARRKRDNDDAIVAFRGEVYAGTVGVEGEGQHAPAR